MAIAEPVALAQFGFVALSFAMLVTSARISRSATCSRTRTPRCRLSASSRARGKPRKLHVAVRGDPSLFGALVAAFATNMPNTLKAAVLAVQAWIAATFYLFILTTSNPSLRPDPAPFEARDLNPILQDLGLAIHPPLLYLGYGGFSISFFFAIAALIEGRIDAAWARRVRPWLLVAWMLTAGISMDPIGLITSSAGAGGGSGIRSRMLR